MIDLPSLLSADAGPFDARSFASRPASVAQFTFRGELGFRLSRALERLQRDLPYTREYLLAQLKPIDGVWTNFPAFHGDMAGRWILAQTLAHGAGRPPRDLQALVDEVVALQREDGSIGAAPGPDAPLEFARLYGQGWLLRALAQYALTFGDAALHEPVRRLVAFYAAGLPRWRQATLDERATGAYAATISCVYHAIDGLVSAHRLLQDPVPLALAEQFAPLVTPLDRADHAHMFLTIRRGLLALARETSATSLRDAVLADLTRVHGECVLETGGLPERFWLPKHTHADDEACSLADWLLLTLELFGETGDPAWMDRAALCLENHVFYNQGYNGGFGSCALGGAYLQQGKEAPWCCSLWMPAALIVSGNHWVERRGDQLHVHHLVSGDFTLDNGHMVRVDRDDTAGCLRIDVQAAPSIREVAVRVPHWLAVADLATGGEWRVARDTGRIAMPFRYRLWAARAGRPPQRLTGAHDGPVNLFLGPWLLTHRVHERPVRARLARGADGEVTGEHRVEWLTGLPFSGRGPRVVVAADGASPANDVFRGASQGPDELYLYPLKDKESPNQSTPRVCLG